MPDRKFKTVLVPSPWTALNMKAAINRLPVKERKKVLREVNEFMSAFGSILDSIFGFYGQGGKQ